MENSFARSAGSCGEFPVYQKWGQDLALDITCAVTISERLLPQEKTEGHPGFLPHERHLFRTGHPPQKLHHMKQR